MGDRAATGTRGSLVGLAVVLGALVLSAPAEAMVSHSFDGSALVLTTSAGDPVDVDCALGNTTVNSVELNTPTVPCASVQSLTVTGDAGANAIDLSGVTAADFTTLAAVLVNAGNGPNGPDDVVIGSPLNDTINGGSGDETITAGAGADTVGGDNGNDTITGGPGDDPDLRGGNANDTLVWNPGDGSDASVNGQGGDDVIQANGDTSADEFTLAGDGDGFDIDRVAPTAGHIEVTGPTEVVTISTGDGTDTITGGADVSAGGVTANAELRGGANVDTITGTEGRDTITGGVGNDVLSGSGGDDTSVWAAGDQDDSFDGGAGIDTAQVTGDANNETYTFGPDGTGVDIDRTVPSTAHIETDTTERVNVSAGDGTDTVTGSAGLAALGVSAILAGGNGADSLTGTDANDSLAGNADGDELTGGAGDDSLSWNGGDGTDVFHGGQGSDAATFNGDPTAETFDLAPDGGDVDFDESAPTTAHVDADTVESVSVNGNAGIDTITAGTGFEPLGVALTLFGGDDPDDIVGSDAADSLNGGAGNDEIDGGDGDDQLTLNPQSVATDDYEGDGGDDTLAVSAESGNGVWTMQPDGAPGKINLARTNVTMLAGTIEHISMDLGSGGDTLNVTGSPLAPLGLQDTTINGDSGNDTINGTDLPDTLDGGASSGVGGDIVHGGDGNDSVSPGAGSGTTTDTVTGDAGDDTLELNGDGSDETIAITPDAGTVDIQRTAASPATSGHVDSNTVEALEVNGGDGADTITGATGIAALAIDTSLSGGPQSDQITGTDAGDEIAGDAGTDTLSGEAGNDTIEALDGEADQVDCGADTDTATIDTGVDATTACETLLPPVVEPPTTTPPTTPTTEDAICVVLRKQLKKAKSKAKRKKLRKKLRKKNC